MIVVFDETGLSERPTVVRTWGKKGETPIIYHSFNWKQLSCIGAVTKKQYYFRLHDGAIDAKRAIAFCKNLKRQISRKLLLIGDGSGPHRSRKFQNYIASTKGKIVFERFPAYAPELNPTEYLWSHDKHHAQPNFCPKTYAELKYRTRRCLRRGQYHYSLVRYFWKQSGLSL